MLTCSEWHYFLLISSTIKRYNFLWIIPFIHSCYFQPTNHTILLISTICNRIMCILILKIAQCHSQFTIILNYLYDIATNHIIKPEPLFKFIVFEKFLNKIYRSEAIPLFQWHIVAEMVTTVIIIKFKCCSFWFRNY